MVGAMLEFPDSNHFLFPPSHHANVGKHICSVDIMMHHKRKVNDKVFLNRKQQREVMITLKIILLLFFNLRIKIATPLKRNGHYKNGLMKRKLSFQLFPQKQQSKKKYARTHRTKGKMELLCHFSADRRLAPLLNGYWSYAGYAILATNPFSCLNTSLL